MEEGIPHQASKKVDLSLCSKYRGIALLSLPGKIFNRVLLKSLKEAVDPRLHDQNAGLRKNRSCAYQIVTLRIILAQSLEWNSPLYVNFIDFEKAFDSVEKICLFLEDAEAGNVASVGWQEKTVFSHMTSEWGCGSHRVISLSKIFTPTGSGQLSLSTIVG